MQLRDLRSLVRPPSACRRPAYKHSQWPAHRSSDAAMQTDPSIAWQYCTIEWQCPWVMVACFSSAGRQLTWQSCSRCRNHINSSTARSSAYMTSDCKAENLNKKASESLAHDHAWSDLLAIEQLHCSSNGRKHARNALYIRSASKGAESLEMPLSTPAES